MTYAAEDLSYFDATTIQDLRSRAKDLGSGIGSFANYLRKDTKKLHNVPTSLRGAGSPADSTFRP